MLYVAIVEYESAMLVGVTRYCARAVAGIGD